MAVRGHAHSLHGLLEWIRSRKLEVILIYMGKMNVRMLSKGSEGKVNMEYWWLSKEIVKLVSCFIS